jgi:hypothetical protein
MGDPQAAFATVMAVLDHHDALDPAGRLRADVRLISVGDHFDYDLADPAAAGREGLRVLRWLADHDPAQVTILLGNHDAARVMELAGIDDATFAAAQTVARAAAAARTATEFSARFPELPTPGLVARDFASFSVAQRDLVVELLRARRFRLAASATLPDGRPILITHAAVTARELALLGLADERDPAVIAGALDDHLRAAVGRCAPAWERGERQPLSLLPLHVAGAPGQGEGGGLLYHRPADPDRPGADPAWEFAASRPRRFDPRTLPLGLTQVAGHTGHAKCLAELGDTWPTARARAQPRGSIRTLRRGADGGSVVYDLGVLAPAPGAGDVVLVDGEMSRVDPATYALLPITELR